MMEPQEWALFALEFDQTFRGDFGPRHEDDAHGAAQEAAFAAHLEAKSVSYGEAIAAMYLLVGDGQVFVPAAAEFLGAVERIRVARGDAPPAPPPFENVWPEVRLAIVRHHTDRDDVAFVADVAEHCGEAAGRWVEARGRRALGLEQVDGDHGGAVMHRLAGEYAGYCGRVTEDRKVGLAIEQATRRAALGPGAAQPRKLGGAMTALVPGHKDPSDA